MDSMDILQWRTNSFTGQQIRYWSKGFFNHTGAVIKYSSFGEDHRWTLEAIATGLHEVYLSDKLAEHNGLCYWFKLADIFEPFRKEAALWLMRRKGKPYDYRSLFKNILGSVFADAKSLFCSEAIFLAWHWAAVKTWSPLLQHLRCEINTEPRAILFIDKGMEKYYSMYPEQRPKAPTPANVLEVLNITEPGGIQLI